MGWKYIAFGPDERLYVPVGAPCNICESEDEIFNSITALDIETKELENITPEALEIQLDLIGIPQQKTFGLLIMEEI